MEQSGIIEDLKLRKNTLFIVRKEKYKNNWQHPEEIIDYVKENFEKIEEIGVFDVYIKQEK